MAELKCPECKKKFEKKKVNQKFCGSKCRWQAWNKKHPRS